MQYIQVETAAEGDTPCAKTGRHEEVDDKDFDAFSKALLKLGNRRSAIGILSGFVALALSGAEEVAGGRKPRLRRQRRRRKLRRRASLRAQPLTPAECATKMRGFGCTFGRVGLADAWTCPPGTEISGFMWGCNLAGAQLQRTKVTAELRGVVLNNADLSYANLEGNSLSHVSMVQTKFVHAEMTRANIVDVEDMRGADFGFANLQRARFDHADLTDAIFEQTNLWMTNWCESVICPDGGRLVVSPECCGSLNGYHTTQCLANPNPRCPSTRSR